MRFWRWLLVAVVAAVMVTGTALAQEKKSQKPKMTPEERFQKLDKNSDGFLSCDEFCAPAAKKPELKEKLEKAFKAMDKDGDGKVSLEEYKAASTKKHKEKKQ
jgi:Ca2+-binding EF-hand superfamily protein